MYNKDNPNIFVRIRRWWKSYIDRTRYDGFIIPFLEDFLPFYYKLNRLYWSIRHRTINVYHKIDTGLKPEYYDIDTLIVHGMFSLLCRYVEREQHGEAKMLEFISDLESNWGTNFEDAPEEHRADYITANQRQADEMKEALRLWRWWKNVYPKYEDYDNSPWSQYCDKRREDGKDLGFFGHLTPCRFDKDGDPTSFELHDNETPEEREESRKALDASREYEIKCEQEITDNLIALIKIRQTLWT